MYGKAGAGKGARSGPYDGGNGGGERVCPYFPLGKCEKGAECKWRHALAGGEAAGLAAGETCPFFLAGKCEKGNQCKWRHALGAGGGKAAGKAAGKGGMCPYFAAGKCERGSECKWSHGNSGGMDGVMMGVPRMYGGQGMYMQAPVQYAPRYASPQFSSLAKQNNPQYASQHAPQAKGGMQYVHSGICPYFQQGKCEKGENCKWRHVMASQAAPGQVCPYFALGKCEKGEACKWRHALGGGSGPAPGKSCPYFALGKCEKGADCKWSHDGTGSAPAAVAAKVCPYFAKGKCSRGAECKWSHE